MIKFFHWLTMGGYSIYVWPAYGIVCVVLVMNFLGFKWRLKQTRTRLKAWFKRSGI